MKSDHPVPEPTATERTATATSSGRQPHDAGDRRPDRVAADIVRRLGRGAARGRHQQEVLEHRIAEVKRWFGLALDDGRQIEAVFRRICDQMTSEERDLFFDEFLNSCGCALSAAHALMRDAFVESVGAAMSRPDRREI